MNAAKTIDMGVELTLRATHAQTEEFVRHAGARRFAYNWCVANNRRLLAEHKAGHAVIIPVSPFDNINGFNKFKRSAEAGIDEQGKIGLPWRKEVYQGVFEEGAKDFARGLQEALTNFVDRKARRTKRKVGFPEFHSRFTTKPTFRLRNTDGERFTVTANAIKVPRFGHLRVRESLRRLRRLLSAPSGGTAGRIAFATISERDGYWRLSLNIQVDAQRATRKRPKTPGSPGSFRVIGCDLGIQTLVAAAGSDGTPIGHFLQPSEVAASQGAIGALQRRLGIKRHASRLRANAAGEKRRTVGKAESTLRKRLSRRFARQRRVREAHLHHVTNALIEKADAIGIEDLHVQGMMKNHCLAAAIARQGWHAFRKQLTYKAARADIPLVVVHRFFPSSKRCRKCHVVKASVPFAIRVFCCNACGLVEDRDVHAAANIALAAEQKLNASPEERGKDKTPELESLETAFRASRGGSPALQHAASRSRDGTTSRAFQASVEARKGGVEFVNAP